VKQSCSRRSTRSERSGSGPS